MSKSEFLSGAIDEIFAIGCFHFVQKPTTPSEGLYDSYASLISEALEKIDNVSNVVATGIDSFHSSGTHPEHKNDDDGYSNIAFIPCPASGSVTFDVFIPARVQEEVFPLTKNSIVCEKFKVLVDYNGDFPMTLIKPGEPLKGDKTLGFSHFVPIVRNYLASRWPVAASLKFACMGPSPFHAEFYFRKGSENELKIEKTKGYDLILYDGENISSFYKQIRAVLPNYYLFIYARNRLMEINYDVAEVIREVLERLTERNIFKQFKNYILHSNRRDIADIYSLDFEAQEIAFSIIENIDSSKRNDGAHSDSLLWDYVDQEIREQSSSKKDGMAQLLRLAEIFEMGGANNTSIVFAALSSALLTALAAVTIAIALDGPDDDAASATRPQTPVEAPRPGNSVSEDQPSD